MAKTEGSVKILLDIDRVLGKGEIAAIDQAVYLLVVYKKPKSVMVIYCYLKGSKPMVCPAISIIDKQ